jgi:hypothetical protein
MKQNPKMKIAQENMQPGVITLQGFLGNDGRDLVQIMDEDESNLESLEVTSEDIADRMDYFKEKGAKGLGEFIDVDSNFAVRVDSVRGKLRCPFEHPGLIPKTNITVKNLNSHREITYTEMNIHCIREHGFFEGKGSFFRIDPEAIVEILELK